MTYDGEDGNGLPSAMLTPGANLTIQNQTTVASSYRAEVQAINRRRR